MSDPAGRAICSTCYFWEANKEPMMTHVEDVPIGQCHRYPTIVTTFGIYWCGEFKPRPTPLPTIEEAIARLYPDR